MRKQKLADNQQLLVVWRRQKVRSTSAAKIDLCTDVIGSGTVLPNWKTVIEEASSCQSSSQESLTPALLGKKPPQTGAQHLLYRSQLPTSRHSTFLGRIELYSDLSESNKRSLLGFLSF